MKKYFKYAGICALVLSVVAFIMVIACKGMKYEISGGGVTLTEKYKGMDIIFAKGDFKNFDKAMAGVFGFILLLVAIVLTAVGVILPLVGKSLDAKIAGIINIVAAVLFILAGILIICVKNSWLDANDAPSNAKKYYDLTVEYAIAGILSILAGVVTLAPAIADFKD